MAFKSNPKSEKMELILDNRTEYSDLVEYQLYEANFVTGLKFVFHRMLDEKRDEQPAAGQPEWMVQNDDSNILAFIGGRGAGKTTSMKEFCRILEDMNGTVSQKKTSWLNNVLEDENDISRLRNSTIRFHILKMVDAALLNESEDLLELILVSLYQEYTDKLEQNTVISRGYQSLMMEIEEIFEDLLTMYSSTRKKNVYNEDYTLATMARLTGNSALIREKISSLLSKMCKLTKRDKECEYEYYVIPIDDLDLNLKHGYEMLEQLQKYFADQRIVILLTMDYDQMCDVCMEHFHQAMEFTDSFSENSSRKRSQILATDMMTKLFPLDQRIFLPDAGKQGKQIRVIEQKDPFETLPVKNFMMKKVAEYMHIYYDAVGTKRHFIEPDTVRQCVFYNYFLDSLYHVDYSNMKTWNQIKGIQDEEEKKSCLEFNRKQMLEYTQNHHRFNDDIAKRQAQSMLTISHRQAFKTFLGFDVSRRAMYLEKAENIEGKIIFADVPMEERNQYSYSDLLQKMYQWGRAHYEDKPFICCVLSSFTSEMVREYVNYRYNPEREKRNTSEERLAKFMGKTFGNAWIGSCLCMKKKPKESGIGTEFVFCSKDVIMKDQMEKTYDDSQLSAKTLYKRKHDVKLQEESVGEGEIIGYRAQAGLEYATLQFSLDYIETYLTRYSNERLLKRRSSDVRKRCIQPWLREENVVQILECLDMFLVESGIPEGTAPAYDGTDIKCILDSQYTKEHKERNMDVKFSGNCMLDIFGFIPKSLDYEKRKQDVDQKIVNALAQFLSSYLSDTVLAESRETISKELTEMVDGLSIFANIEDQPIKNEVAFPFYDLDLAYNVIKRFRGKMAEETKNNLYDYLLCIYDTLQSLLEEEGKEYRKGHDDASYCYDQIFQESAFIEAFRSLNKNEKARESISSFLMDLTGWSASLYQPEDSFD